MYQLHDSPQPPLTTLLLRMRTRKWTRPATMNFELLGGARIWNFKQLGGAA